MVFFHLQINNVLLSVLVLGEALHANEQHHLWAELVVIHVIYASIPCCTPFLQREEASYSFPWTVTEGCVCSREDAGLQAAGSVDPTWLDHLNLGNPDGLVSGIPQRSGWRGCSKTWRAVGRTSQDWTELGSFCGS
ncbi:hypothetical protein H8959_018058, partial [Pygathrix nigripes]